MIKHILVILLGLSALGLLTSEPVMAQATDVACSGCVGSGDIADGAVKGRHIANGSLVSKHIKNGNIRTEKIRDGAITESKLAAGAVGVTQIDPTQVQMRVGGSCAVGSFIAAIAENGSVICETGTSDAPLFNTGYGQGALASITIGRWNTASGVDALGENTEGNFNTATGVNALWLNTTGSSNTATGVGALLENIDGWSNTATGRAALHLNVSGNDNVATGVQALYSNTLGLNNTAVGAYALNSNAEGSFNTAVGQSALLSNTSGSYNTAIGEESLWSNTIGNENIVIGRFAGYDTTGDRNIVIGNAGVADESNTIRVGNANHTRAFIHGIQGRTTGIADAVAVVIDSNGQLGTVSSSRRYKEDIQDMGEVSGRLLDLRPVTFRYKEAYENGEKPLDYGLIAEEVAEMFPELVVYNEEGQPETVKYRLLSSMLLNELQKEHQTNQQQAVALETQSQVNEAQEAKLASIADQSAEITELRAQIAELNQLVQQMAKLALPASELVATNAGD